MSDEIKEILEQLEWYRKIGKKDVYYPECVLPNKKAFILLDYITNLQEGNEILKRDIEAMKHNYNLLVKCIENGESMTQKFENGLTYQDYKSRCEKAIEYINTHYLNANEPELLNILTGGDKE